LCGAEKDRTNHPIHKLSLQSIHHIGIGFVSCHEDNNAFKMKMILLQNHDPAAFLPIRSDIKFAFMLICLTTFKLLAINSLINKK